MFCASEGENSRVGHLPHGIPTSRVVQHGGPSLPPDPPGTPSPRWPLQSWLCGAWAGWQRVAEERAAIQACWREENNFFLPYFSLYSVPAQPVSVGI